MTDPPRALFINPFHVYATVSGINVGIKLYRQGKYEKALRIFRKAAKRKSDDPEVHAMVGMALHKLGRQFEALDACHEAQALADVAVQTHCAEINAAREMGRDDLVGNATAKAVRAYDSMIRAGYVRAKAFGMLTMFDEAAAELGGCVDLNHEDPTEREILDMIRYALFTQGNRHGRRAVPIREPGDSPPEPETGTQRRTRNLVNTFTSTNAYKYSFPDPDADAGPDRPSWLESLLESIDKNLELDAGDVEAYRRKADMMHDVGRMRECDEALDAALAIDPGDLKSAATRGLRLYEGGRVEEGRRLVEECFARNNLDDTVRFCRAFLLACEGDREGAVEACKSAILDYPNLSRLHALIVAILETLTDV